MQRGLFPQIGPLISHLLAADIYPIIKDMEIPPEEMADNISNLDMGALSAMHKLSLVHEGCDTADVSKAFMETWLLVTDGGWVLTVLCWNMQCVSIVNSMVVASDVV